ncbi:pyridoxamine 5'-phosphate oxidase family protein [Geopsychrobacter electrodiphilus]|uniref:pyridoxamine 5'-phosphate oxidase family protein n=1 Tax=Geopsychrobacter electrodiphilus TaxID=225196 RepID=UPI00036A56CC|nr:pyridoxamine 5'-phosphate oxidase family protein [Geopsychrobacter electrodiphilus]
MRRSEKAVTHIAGLEQILWQGRVCQLAIADVPSPYIVSLSYGYGDGILYFHSAAEGHKIELLHCNPQVGFSVVVDLGIVEGEQPCNWGARFRSVVGQGRVEFIEESESKRTALKLLMAQYGEGAFDFPLKAIEETTVFRLVIKEMTGKQSRV